MRPFGRSLSHRFNMGHPGDLMWNLNRMQDRIWPELLDLRITGRFEQYRDAIGWDILRSVDSQRRPIMAALGYRS